MVIATINFAVAIVGLEDRRNTTEEESEASEEEK